MAKLSTAEKNKRKRERKKREREEQRKRDEEEQKQQHQQLLEEQDQNSFRVKKEEMDNYNKDEEVEIEYVAEPLLLPIAISSSSSIENRYGEEKKVDAVKEEGNSGASGTVQSTNEQDGKEKEEDSSMEAVLLRFQSRAAVLISDDEDRKGGRDDGGSANTDKNGRDKNSFHDEEDDDGDDDDDEDDEEDEDREVISKRKLREMNRPTVAELKTKVVRADLVEAHDVTASDPEFLLALKSVPGTVPVPRHWGRKRKYLQGKRGIEKAPFQLPDFIAKTGITEIRSAVAEDESKMSAKQKNRGRVAPKMGSLDVDYRTLHDAFFKHQNRASIQSKLTKMGDLYYEGKEFETQKSSNWQVGGMLSITLREALGMTAENSPPPWLINMQRYGPPPSYPNLKIPGLNAPLPDAGCSYGYHLNGWGKPPVDAFGRPLYGGNPFDAPGSSGAGSTSDWDFDAASGSIVTSDGKTIGRKPWGGLPMAGIDSTYDDEYGDDEEGESSSEEESGEESSGEEMAESDEEGGDGAGGDDNVDVGKDGVPAASADDVVPADGVDSVLPGSAMDLRKQAGDETPAPAATKQLYTVLQQRAADKEEQAGAVFASDVAYVLPGGAGGTGPEGAESVLSKAPAKGDASKRKRNDLDDDEEEADLSKKFKF